MVEPLRIPARVFAYLDQPPKRFWLVFFRELGPDPVPYLRKRISGLRIGQAGL